MSYINIIKLLVLVPFSIFLLSDCQGLESHNSLESSESPESPESKERRALMASLAELVQAPETQARNDRIVDILAQRHDILESPILDKLFGNRFERFSEKLYGAIARGQENPASELGKSFAMLHNKVHETFVQLSTSPNLFSDVKKMDELKRLMKSWSSSPASVSVAQDIISLFRNNQGGAPITKPVEIDTTKKDNEYSFQDYIDYINSDKYFHKFELKKGAKLYRCDDKGNTVVTSWPGYYGLSLAFKGYNYKNLTGGLCIGRDVYEYEVVNDFTVVDFRHNENRVRLPNGTVLKSKIGNIAPFYPSLHQMRNYGAHILDATIDAYVKADSLKRTAKEIYDSWNTKSIGRVHFFCNTILPNDGHVNGWIDYDIGFIAPEGSSPHKKTNDETKKIHELLICNPDKYVKLSTEIDGKTPIVAKKNPL